MRVLQLRDLRLEAHDAFRVVERLVLCGVVLAADRSDGVVVDGCDGLFGVVGGQCRDLSYVALGGSG
ncbi:MAG: hypothetical protein OXH97_04975 [Chloroflexota bacterium]|nr:hypothetical protein [Chloroflexota bacterium]